MYKIIIGLVLLSCASCEIALAISGKVVPVPGAKPVGKDTHGNNLYLANDLMPAIRTTELRPEDETLALDPTVYNGTKSLDGEFPAHGWIGNCTATAVGPKVIFTASHCVNTGTRVTFQHRGSSAGYPATCNRHPRVNTNNWYNDYNFCVLDNSLPIGTQFASFSQDPYPDRGVETLINGFGAPNIRVHYWGRASVDQMQGQDIVTCGPANLGSGDSGGSLLKWVEDRVNAVKHIILGVNSRGGGGCSYFNSAAHPEFKSWSKEFALAKGIEICGVNKDCVTPVPPPDDNKCTDEKLVVSFVENLLVQAKSRLEICRKLP